MVFMPDWSLPIKFLLNRADWVSEAIRSAQCIVDHQFRKCSKFSSAPLPQIFWEFLESEDIFEISASKCSRKVVWSKTFRQNLQKGATLINKCTLFWQTAPQFDQGHIIDKEHLISAGSSALSKLNACCRLHAPSRTVVHYVKQICNSRKRLPQFQTNVRVTKSIEMCRNQMKRCRFGVQNGVFPRPTVNKRTG